MAVTFDHRFFAARYAEFATVAPEVLAAYFDEATLYVGIGDDSLIPEQHRRIIAHMVTAHIAELASTPLVGRVRSVAVSVTNTNTVVDTQPGSQGWYEQTKYGYAAWEAMSPYRCCLYIGPDEG